MSAAHLDPDDWSAFGNWAHQLLDDMLNHMQTRSNGAVWTPMPEHVVDTHRSHLPASASPLDDLRKEFLTSILPYGAGNAHPGFMGWVQGGGTPIGAMADMLAASMNINAGGRNQISTDMEREITAWMAELFEFPPSAGGLFLTGTSMANLVAVWIARVKLLGAAVRNEGVAGAGEKFIAYTSEAAHGCVAQAFDLAGFGRKSLSRVRLDESFRMSVADLEHSIESDLKAGRKPWMVIATAGSVDTGAIDPLNEIADLCQRYRMWFHIDGAFGAMAQLSRHLNPLLAGIARADSIAFDFHKWAQVPYDAGFLLTRDIQTNLDTFAADLHYLRREPRGLAANSPWPCDLGPDLSRSFRALKTWFTFKAFGRDGLAAVVEHTCALARQLAHAVDDNPLLELGAPVTLNIVCYRFVGMTSGTTPVELDRINADIAVRLQEQGLVAPSTTRINDRLMLRAAIVNHRTELVHIETLLTETIRVGQLIMHESTSP